MSQKITVLTKQQLTPLLREIHDCPKRLFCLGNIGLFREKFFVGVVGARRATSYGLTQSEKISYELARAGVVVVSGLAIGIDGQAHRGALRAEGKTIAVLGTAIDQLYPHTHIGLAKEILRQGGLIISEYEAGAPFYKENFLARNRIIAGLSQAVIVTEAAKRSGALVTAAFALEDNRDVFSLPGDITRQNSIGTNGLIKQGAFPLTDTSDVLKSLGIEENKLNLVELSKEEKLVFEVISSDKISFDKILDKVKVKPSQLNPILLQLEIKGLVKSIGLGEYQKI